MNTAVKDSLIEIGQRIYAEKWIVAGEGNFSIRISENRILATPSGLCKGKLRRDDIVEIDYAGEKISGKHSPSSEIAMHLAVYKNRKDVKAVIHAHPPHCIALMLAGYTLDVPLLAETVIALGKVPTLPYARPSTTAVPTIVEKWIDKTDFLLLDKHGSLTVGNSIEEAFTKLEILENTAKTYHLALQIGNVKSIDAEEIAALNDLRINRYHIPWRLIPF